METVYIDELFALNFIIDYLIVLCAARVCGAVLRRGRYAGAAFFGALYAVGTLLPGLAILSAPWAKLLCGAAMAGVAFWGEAAFLKCALAFFAVSAAFGGAVWGASMLSGVQSGGSFTYFPASMRELAVSFAVCYAVVSVVFRRSLKSSQRKIITVAAVMDGRRAVFRALRDTGNCLYDPVTGGEVLIASAKAVSPLLPPDCGDILGGSDPVEILERLGCKEALRGRVRLIPYSSVGVPSGLLPVIRPDRVSADGKERPGALIAVSPALEDNGEYEAVL